MESDMEYSDDDLDMDDTMDYYGKIKSDINEVESLKISIEKWQVRES
jgi:hypothetical protein